MASFANPSSHHDYEIYSWLGTDNWFSILNGTETNELVAGYFSVEIRPISVPFSSSVARIEGENVLKKWWDSWLFIRCTERSQGSLFDGGYDVDGGSTRANPKERMKWRPVTTKSIAIWVASRGRLDSLDWRLDRETQWPDSGCWFINIFCQKRSAERHRRRLICFMATGRRRLIPQAYRVHQLHNRGCFTATASTSPPSVVRDHLR